MSETLTEQTKGFFFVMYFSFLTLWYLISHWFFTWYLRTWTRNFIGELLLRKQWRICDRQWHLFYSSFSLLCFSNVVGAFFVSFCIWETISQFQYLLHHFVHTPCAYDGCNHQSWPWKWWGRNYSSCTACVSLDEELSDVAYFTSVCQCHLSKNTANDYYVYLLSRIRNRKQWWRMPHPLCKCCPCFRVLKNGWRRIKCLALFLS